MSSLAVLSLLKRRGSGGAEALVFPRHAVWPKLLSRDLANHPTLEACVTPLLHLSSTEVDWPFQGSTENVRGFYGMRHGNSCTHFISSFALSCVVLCQQSTSTGHGPLSDGSLTPALLQSTSYPCRKCLATSPCASYPCPLSSSPLSSFRLPPSPRTASCPLASSSRRPALLSPPRQRLWRRPILRRTRAQSP